MEIPQIVATKDYQIFKILENNRLINRHYVTTLAKSIETNNLLSYNPIIVNGDMEVIDGQHRLEAAKLLHLPIYYVIAPHARFNEVMLLNANLKQWRLMDYLRIYVQQGKPDYIQLEKFSQRFRLSVSNAMALLSINEESLVFRAPYDTFKAGKFMITSQSVANEIADTVNQMAPYAEAFAERDRDFIAALYRIYTKQEIYLADLVEKVKQSDKRLQRQTNVMGYLRQFEDIYNVKAHKQVRFY